MSPMIVKRLLAVVVFVTVLGIGSAGKVTPSEAAATTAMVCVSDPAPPISDAPWNSTREHPGQPY